MTNLITNDMGSGTEPSVQKWVKMGCEVRVMGDEVFVTIR